MYLIVVVAAATAVASVVPAAAAAPIDFVASVATAAAAVAAAPVAAAAAAAAAEVHQLGRGSVTVKRCNLDHEISRHTPLPCPLCEVPRTGSLSKKIYVKLLILF